WPVVASNDRPRRPRRRCGSVVLEQTAGGPVISVRGGAKPPAADAGEIAAGRVVGAAADAGPGAAGRVDGAAADAGGVATCRVGEAAADARTEDAGRVVGAAADAGEIAAGQIFDPAADAGETGGDRVAGSRQEPARRGELVLRTDDEGVRARAVARFRPEA